MAVSLAEIIPIYSPLLSGFATPTFHGSPFLLLPFAYMFPPREIRAYSIFSESNISTKWSVIYPFAIAPKFISCLGFLK